ncbi:DEAD/DEAH box helicase [Boudabousia marimammalium]|uniref:RNA helicase n=1 Tax=Boudabousia marimammalium TaxID=156892 RepID=A0A1Q5PM67_9ACTO|nr:DEAD/DEAH box helicase [Boudabousia marimammalium]OKL48102.1 DNA helicase [Boudabousia marimammalium]
MTEKNEENETATVSGVVNLEDVSGPAPEVQVAADITDEDGSTVDLDQKSFLDFGVDERIAKALTEEGITYPFPIQALTLPVALGRHDIIGQAKTGTGKTLGFGIPALMSVLGPKDEGFDKILTAGAPQALIIVPTRELCKQVAQDLKVASKYLSARVLEIYGGVGFDAQIDQLEKGVEIVVGTPGRLLDLMKRKNLVLSGVKTVILDEADEMLDLGFLPDVETLLSRTPANRHTMLFSATMPGAIVAMARRYMTRPTHIRAQDPTDQGATVKSIKQVVYRAHNLNKPEVVTRILQAEGRGKTIIFARTKRTCARLCEELVSRNFAAGALHGDLGQGAREQAMRAFRNGKIDVLVATDVAARGLDIDDVTHVINYQCPEDEKIYLHRIGRTGRAGASGTAVTFVDWDDVPRWSLIDRALGLGKPEPVETYHTSEHLYNDLNIPRDAKDRIARSKRTAEGLDAEEYVDLGGSSSGRGTGHGKNHGRGGRSGGHQGGRGSSHGEGRGRGRRRSDNGDSSGERRASGRAPGERRPRRRRSRSGESAAE